MSHAVGTLGNPQQPGEWRTRLKTIFEAATPRPDVLLGDLRDEIFAAQLEAIIAGRADRIYQDPTDFFANT